MKSQIATIMKSLSHKDRIRIVNLLADGQERNCEQIRKTLKNMSQAMLSRHMGDLRRAGVITITRRDGTYRYYDIQMQEAKAILAVLQTINESDPAFVAKPVPKSQAPIFRGRE